MKTSIQESLTHERNRLNSCLEVVNKMEVILSRIDTSALSDTASINPAGGSLWIEVYNREDLAIALGLAAVWRKSNDLPPSLDYLATIDGIPVRVRAFATAMPPTCKVVEIEVEMPAEPSRTVKRIIVECQPEEANASTPSN